MAADDVISLQVTNKSCTARTLQFGCCFVGFMYSKTIKKHQNKTQSGWCWWKLASLKINNPSCEAFLNHHRPVQFHPTTGGDFWQAIGSSFWVHWKSGQEIICPRRRATVEACGNTATEAREFSPCLWAFRSSGPKGLGFTVVIAYQRRTVCTQSNSS